MNDTIRFENKKINSLQFGVIEVEAQNIFRFKDGLLGFEDLRDFVLVNAEDTAPFKWLISVETPEIGFPLISPWLIDLSYAPGPNIDLSKEVPMVVVTLGDELGRMTANLKAPIILDVDLQTGSQIILPSDKYSTNYVLSK